MNYFCKNTFMINLPSSVTMLQPLNQWGLFLELSNLVYYDNNIVKRSFTKIIKLWWYFDNMLSLYDMLVFFLMMFSFSGSLAGLLPPVPTRMNLLEPATRMNILDPVTGVMKIGNFKYRHQCNFRSRYLYCYWRHSRLVLQLNIKSICSWQCCMLLKSSATEQISSQHTYITLHFYFIWHQSFVQRTSCTLCTTQGYTCMVKGLLPTHVSSAVPPPPVC